jgi:hypothetical protein
MLKLMIKFLVYYIQKWKELMSLSKSETIYKIIHTFIENEDLLTDMTLRFAKLNKLFECMTTADND